MIRHLPATSATMAASESVNGQLRQRIAERVATVRPQEPPRRKAAGPAELMAWLAR